MKKIKIMLSSRCNDNILCKDGSTKTFTEVRKSLKTKIEDSKVIGRRAFEVWINEDSPSLTLDEDGWDACLNQVSECDILIALVNGNAGWAKTDSQIGICHAELMTAIGQSPGKVTVVKADDAVIVSTNSRDKKFAHYLESQNPFRQTYKTVEELETATLSALSEAVISLTKKGVREASKGRYHSGDALEWTRMSYAMRSNAMRAVVFETMTGKQISSGPSEQAISVSISGNDVYFFVSAIPDSLSLSAAAEMVGRPHLDDHTYASDFVKKECGPVHIIACHKNITPSQAIKIIGHSDVVLVDAPFGLYVADNVQKVQMVFVKDCRDRTTTVHAVQRFEDWLTQSGEDKYLAERAISRTRIAKAIAKEVK